MSNEDRDQYNLSANEVYRPEDEIGLTDLFMALWKGKWIIIITTVLFAVGSVIYALNQPNIYKAYALLAPTESSDSGGLAKIAGQFGGLAALTGVSLGSGDTSKTDLAVQVMSSRKFISSFIENNDLLVPLMAAKGWVLEKNTLIIDDEKYSESDKKWLRKPDGLRGVAPTEQEAYELFIKEIFSIKQDKASGLYTVSMTHYSPYVAKQWVDWIVNEINRVMRERTISEVSNNLVYLNQQLNKTSVAEMQSTFYKLIEEQTKTLMLAEAQEEFIFKVVDPAVVPEVKVKPARALICIAGTFLGFILGAMVSIVLSVYRKR
ncbi:LPS O-antigen length regulator [Vibrio parahaemolyticus]|uniref:Wzz/FepE/Etk N-terminal domain-containing protein n=1 Tax=Vibrio parahaemolyticus TaxID=670 RepID=UPI0005F11390|nr:Wzz/FepE/Etk N-terminal domain-containing protein [Vibrio parahaemolyticus]EIU6822063.1 LPS O-antigen length regulator [Vibrio parahaemolyticus]ELI5393979.1 LPS O-antigen length regulator [Vibrio parahaemolyticus]MBM5067211.1 LPS O-antigen length regulator [Vibrio parahaemolyticus]HCG6558161.1 LPS O-antigen length regulator [Vibrio parahaemolyticus]